MRPENLDSLTITLIHAGFGCNDKVLIEIISQRTNEDLQLLRRAYQSEFGRDLIEDIKSETGANFERILCALLWTRAEADAHSLRKAFEGVGARIEPLIETLVHRTKEEREAIKAAYLQMYGKTLQHDIEKELDGDNERLFVALINNTPQELPLDVPYLEQVADDLFKRGEGKWGTDEVGFITTLTSCSPVFLKEVNIVYALRHSHSLVTAIGEEMGGHRGKTLKALISDHDEYYADLFWKSMEGAGCNEDMLMRIIASRRHKLRGISRAFIHKYGCGMKHKIDKEMGNGDFGKVVKEITKGF